MPTPKLRLGRQRFGRLLVIARVANTHDGKSVWSCHCDCGNDVEVRQSNLRSGRATSCGCYHVERVKASNTVHGEAGKTPEHKAWCAMIQRCENENNVGAEYYSGRGITICDRWRNGEDGQSGYECFLADMGRRPSARHSLDRRKNDEGYSKGNCRWATLSEQNKNRRPLKRTDAGQFAGRGL